MTTPIIPTTARHYLGYFTEPGQADPVYDPGPDAPCAVCGVCLAGEPVRTISLMWGDQHVLCVFYRCHRRCHDTLGTDARNALDGKMLDLLKERP